MSLPKDKAWFAAKRYGYGWGFPVRWQGWIILAVYFVTLLICGLAVAQSHPMLFLGYAVLLSAILVALCAWKGETPRWRWAMKTEKRNK